MAAEDWYQSKIKAGRSASTLDKMQTYLDKDILALHHLNRQASISLSGRKLIINDAKALIHTVEDTLCLSPGIFQRYAQEHPEVSPIAKQDQVKDWQWIQKRFERLQLHRKQANGLNIWMLKVTGPRKSRKVHEYLMADPAVLMNETPPNNPYLSLIERQGNEKADPNGTHA